MSKVLWLKVDWNNTYDQVKSTILDSLFTRNSEKGFLLDKSRDDLIEGRYIEKKIIKAEYSDPFNQLLSYELVKYDFICFKLINNITGLEITNPPRSIKEFLNTLAIFSDFKISIDTYYPNILSWYEQIKKYFDEIEIKNLICDEIKFSEKVIGRLYLYGGNDIINITNNYKDAKIKEITFTYRHSQYGNGKCTLTNTGYCKIDSNYDYKNIASIFLKELINIST